MKDAQVVEDVLKAVGMEDYGFSCVRAPRAAGTNAKVTHVFVEVAVPSELVYEKLYQLFRAMVTIRAFPNALSPEAPVAVFPVAATNSDTSFAAVDAPTKLNAAEAVGMPASAVQVLPFLVVNGESFPAAFGEEVDNVLGVMLQAAMDDESKHIVQELMDRLVVYHHKESAEVGPCLAQTQAQLAALSNRLGTVETRLDAIETRLDTMETRLDTMDTRLVSIETQEIATKESVAKIAKSMHFMQRRLATRLHREFAAMELRIAKTWRDDLAQTQAQPAALRDAMKTRLSAGLAVGGVLLVAILVAVLFPAQRGVL